MFLEKWYADVCDADRVDVLYLANLTLGPARIGYRGRIAHGGRASAVIVPGGVQLPRAADGAVAWPASGSGSEEGMRWEGRHPLEVPLWHRDRQLLAWSPLVLNGAVSGGGLSPAARGYVERLTLNFAPWRLGLQRLRWGRFCGERHSFVWIEWEGRQPLRLAMLDGRPSRLRDISLDRVGCDEATLRLTQKRALVQEPIGEGALRPLVLPRRLAALSFFRGVESKWFARGELALAEDGADPGHAVFEDVVWT